MKRIYLHQAREVWLLIRKPRSAWIRSSLCSSEGVHIPNINNGNLPKVAVGDRRGRGCIVKMRGREMEKRVGMKLITSEAVFGTKQRYSCHRFYMCPCATVLPRHTCASLQAMSQIFVGAPKISLVFYLSKSFSQFSLRGAAL